MNRLNALFPIFLIAIISISCSGGEGVKISGRVESKLEGESIIIYKLLNELTPIDTMEVAKDGSFSAYLDPSEPTFYQLNFFGRQKTNLILDGAEEEVTLKLDGNQPNGEVLVEGSRHTKYLQDLNGIVSDYQLDVQELNQQAIQARMNSNQSRMNELTQNYQALVMQSQQNVKDYIWKITPSLAGIFGLQYLSIDENLSFYDSVATRYSQELPGNVFTEDLVSRVNDAKRLSVGSLAPEISLPTPDGDIVSLSSLRGNYVLIDFWAAWCRPCRAENPNVVRVYNEYSKQNFEILGVSLDRTKEAWVKAIEQDGLPWKHVSDLKYFNSEAAAEYGIDAIPATYLVDPEGKIIAKGLRGNSLEAKLREIFG